MNRIAKKHGGGTRQISCIIIVVFLVCTLTVRAQAVDTSSLPEFAEKPYIEVNNNEPFFTETDMSVKAFENYSQLDSMGRCGVAYANICKDIMPTDKRGKIGSVKPSGWHLVKYSFVDGKYLYNRCHLIGFQLAGENANNKNLITGTRYLNIDGMLSFENLVADYVKDTGNHVLYRVTPIYEGENLVASGILMEGKSVEDNGRAISYCIYAYNNQPGVTIDYKNGASSQSKNYKAELAAAVNEGAVSVNVTNKEKTSNADDDSIAAYILNTNTHKFHKPSCRSVKQMSDKNKKKVTAGRGQLISEGYEPCKSCNP